MYQFKGHKCLLSFIFFQQLQDARNTVCRAVLNKILVNEEKGGVILCGYAGKIIVVSRLIVLNIVVVREASSQDSVPHSNRSGEAV